MGQGALGRNLHKAQLISPRHRVGTPIPPEGPAWWLRVTLELGCEAAGTTNQVTDLAPRTRNKRLG